jgi:hypothetical protein
VVDRRKPSDFRAIGAVAVERLGFSAKRAAELRIAQSWRRIAGGLAERFPPRVRRSVLEVEAPDPAWERTLDALLPELVARLAREEPALGLRAFRIDCGEKRGAVTPIEVRGSPPPGARRDRTGRPARATDPRRR